jgi:hypothetical protein
LLISSSDSPCRIEYPPTLWVPENGVTLCAFEGRQGSGVSDKVSDNGSRQRPTQRDVPRHRDPSELR